MLGSTLTSPAFQLQVSGDANTTGSNIQIGASNTSTSTSSLAYVSARANNDATIAILAADGLGTGPLHTAGGFFGTYSSQPAGIVTGNVERMRVTTAGNVGIGTTSPAALLEVNGTAKFDNSVTFTSGQTFPNTISTINTPSSGGLTGGGSSSSLTLGLTTSCSNGQILQWNSSSSSWACTTVSGTGTITGVTVGTDLTGGGTAGMVTLNLDTTKVPQLATANTFTASQTIQGPSPWIDVTAYNADPTGTNDSTDQINNAINAFPQTGSGGNSNGCTVFFPPGKYRIAGGTTNGIQITQNSLGVRLLGAGAASATNPAAASELVNTMTGANYVISVECISSGAVCSDGSITNVNGVAISNLGFLDSSGSPYLTGGAILLRDAQYFSIDGVSCESFVHSACITMWGDTVSGAPVYTQFGSIKDLFSQGLYGITTFVPSTSTATSIVSEVTILGGNISCLGGGGAISGGIGVDLDGSGGHNGENQLFGIAVNDCNTGYQLKNAGTNHLVGKFECDSAGMTNCGAYGLLMDNPDTSNSYSGGNVITLQVSKAQVGVQVNDSGGPGTAPAKEEIVGATFQGNQAADICVNSNSLTTAMILVAQAGVGTLGTGCSSGTLVTGSQFATGVGLPSSNSAGAVMVTWGAGSSAPSASTCTTGTLGSLFSDSGTTATNAFWVCQESGGVPTWMGK
jgi:hypothetical protein